MSTADKLQTEREGPKAGLSSRFTGILFLLVSAITALLFINSPYFDVTRIVVEGNKYLATEEVLRIAAISRNANIFRLNLAEVKNSLTGDLRVADAAVVRQLPDTIVLRIVERKPIAYISGNYGFVEVDKQGIVLAVHKNIKQSHIPIMTGYRAGTAYVGDTVVSSPSVDVGQLLLFLSLLDETAVNQLSEINVKGDRLFAYTTTAVNIRLGNFERLEEKARLLSGILTEISQKKMDVEYIDLTYASPYIKVKQ